MPSVQSTLLFTTLVTSALAAPAPASAPLVPRSFEVPRIRNVNAPKPDGAAAMAKAFNKFGWGTIGAQKRGMTGASMSGAGAGSVQQAANGTTGKGDDGSVNAGLANMGAEFLSPVMIGNQQFNMDFDSGSSDL